MTYTTRGFISERDREWSTVRDDDGISELWLSRAPSATSMAFQIFTAPILSQPVSIQNCKSSVTQIRSFFPLKLAAYKLIPFLPFLAVCFEMEWKRIPRLNLHIYNAGKLELRISIYDAHVNEELVK